MSERFPNDRSLTAEEIEALGQWHDARSKPAESFVFNVSLRGSPGENAAEIARLLKRHAEASSAW